MSYDPNQEVHVAEIVAQPAEATGSSPGEFDPPVKKSRSCLYVFLIVLLLSLLMVIGAGVAIYRTLAPQDVIVENETEAIERRETEQASVRKAFSSRFSYSDQQELDQIKKLIDRVAEAADDEVHSEIHECIDFMRYAREARRNPEANRLAFFGNTIFAATAQQRTVGPIPFSEYQIFGIETLSEDERKITLQTWGTYEDIAPYVWWVAKSERNVWKLYDWEPIEFGVRDSKENAILLGEDDPARIRAYETYVETVVDYVEESDDGPSDMTKLKMMDCQKLSFHEKLADSTLYNIATHLLSNDDYESAKTFLDAVKVKDATPGSHRLLGEIALHRNEFKKATEHFETYLSLIGPNRQVLNNLAQAYAELGDKVNELKTHRMAIPLMIDGYSESLGKAFLLESKENLLGLLADIEALNETIRPFNGLVNQTSSNPFAMDKFKVLVDFLDQRALKPGAGKRDRALAVDAKAQLAFTKGEFEQGLACLESVSTLDDESSGFEYWTQAIDMGVVVDKFKSAKDKEKAFENISYIFEEYEYDYEMKSSDFIEVAKLAIESDPENAVYYHLVGSAAYNENDFESAIKYLLKAEQRFGEDAEEYQVNYNSLLLAYCHFSLGDFEEVLKVGNGGLDQDGLKAILNFAVNQKKLAKFEDLIDSMEPDEKEYLQALLLMEKGKYAEAKTGLVKMLKVIKSEEYGYGNNSYRVISGLIECCEQEGSVIDAFIETNRKDVFDRVARTLIRNRDWERASQLAVAGRRHLAKRTSRAVNLQSVLNLEHEVLWRQGKFKELANATAFDRDLARIELLDDEDFPDLEFIFRAALRTNNLVLADLVASLTRALEHPNFDILRLMALHQKDYARFDRLRIENPNDVNSVFDDRDCPKLSKKKIRELSKDAVTPIEYVYGSYYESQKLSVLLTLPLVLDAAWAKEISKGVFSDPVTVEEMDDQANGQKGWLVRSGNHVISISQSNTFVIPTRFEKDELQAAFSSAKQIIHFEFDSFDWKSNEPYSTFLKFAKNLSFENGGAIGFEDQWMSWDEGTAALDKLVQGEISTIAFEALIADNYFLIEEAPSSVLESDAKFQVSFAEAYEQFAESKSTDKQLVVSARIFAGNVTETIEIAVETIDLGTWSMNELKGKLLKTSRIDPSLEKDDPVELDTNSVFRWKLKVDGEKTSNEN